MATAGSDSSANLRIIRHENAQRRAYEILATRREAAEKDSHFNSRKTRDDLARLFKARSGFPPHEWQLDATEATLLGLDSLVIAGTGFGKTIPFMMLLLAKPESIALIVSPLKVLQADQCARFRKMGITAEAVNGETWDAAMGQRIKSGQVQAILAGPEMYGHHSPFRDVLRVVSERVGSIIVDEAHCIQQWGTNFRKDYALLDNMRALVRKGTPVMAATATASAETVNVIKKALSMDIDTTFHINLGNDRPNIHTSIHLMKNAFDFPALLPHLTLDVADADLIPKTIIFVNTIPAAQRGLRWLRAQLPEHLKYSVDVIHSLRSPRDKRKVMRKFRQGQVRIVIATEAAALGADIPDIKVGVQFGTPLSLAVLKQRLGRIGRDATVKANGIVILEESMFRIRAVCKRAKEKEDPGVGLSAIEEIAGPALPLDEGDEENGEVAGDQSDDEVEMPEVAQVKGKSKRAKQTRERMLRPRKTSIVEGETEYCMNVGVDVRGWAETESCERDYSDNFFLNPGQRKPPSNGCCCRCDMHRIVEVRPTLVQAAAVARVLLQNSCSLSTAKAIVLSGSAPPPVDCDLERPSTPPNTLTRPPPPESPSKVRNTNNKRPMASRRSRDELPLNRQSEFLATAKAAIDKWVTETMSKMPFKPFTGDVLLPPKVRTTLAQKTGWNTERLAELPWCMAHIFGGSLLDCLDEVDGQEQQRQDSNKRRREEAHAREAAARASAKEEKQRAAVAKKAEMARRKKEKAEAIKRKEMLEAESRRVAFEREIRQQHNDVQSAAYARDQAFYLAMRRSHAGNLYDMGTPVTPSRTTTCPSPASMPPLTPVIPWRPFPYPTATSLASPGMSHHHYSPLAPPGPSWHPQQIPGPPLPPPWPGAQSASRIHEGQARPIPQFPETAPTPVRPRPRPIGPPTRSHVPSE